MPGITQLAQKMLVKPMQQYLRACLTKHVEKYPRLVIPNVGNFELVFVALKAGYLPENIYCSGTTMYSTIVGTLLNDLNMKESSGVELLEAEYVHERLQMACLDPYHAGSLLFAQTVAQVQDSTPYRAGFWEDLWDNIPEHCDKLDEQVRAFAEKMRGVSFVCEGIDTTVEKFKEDGGALILMFPPDFYWQSNAVLEKHFRNYVTWKQPKTKTWENHYSHLDLLMKTKDTGALTLLYWDGPDTSKVTVSQVGDPVYGFQRERFRWFYLFTNREREFEKDATLRRGPKSKRGKWPLLPLDYEVTDESRIWFEKIRPEVALYYRDLFAHKLGLTLSHTCYAGIIDGYLCSTIGINMQFAIRGICNNDLMKPFGFAVPSKRHPRINKLMGKCSTSKEFKDLIVRDHRTLQLHEPGGMLTICLSEHPEMKSNRGVMKLIEKEVMPEGSPYKYHLRYRADFTNMSFADCRDWSLKKERAIG